MAGDELDLSLEGGNKEKGEKKGKSKLIIIIAGLAVLLAAGGFFGWWFFLSSPSSETPAAKEQAQGDKATPAGEAGKEGAAEGEAAGEAGGPKAQDVGAIIKLEPFVVNLADPTGKRYLKLSLAVDAKDEAMKAQIDARMPQIRDSILLLLTSKSYADISSVAGKIRLRNEVLQIFNRALKGHGAVHAVYFMEFVIQ
ncbi:MAG: flagellar basal body-associated FliL family protein [Deltaproteobacteria bacterium]|nr:flagellar basal body-associated FliL family protein [Deltaproteobacteria bacterium]